MANVLRQLTAVVFLSLGIVGEGVSHLSAADRPNIVLIIADDKY